MTYNGREQATLERTGAFALLVWVALPLAGAGGGRRRLLPADTAGHQRRRVRRCVSGDRDPVACLHHQGLPPGPNPAQHRRGNGGITVSHADLNQRRRSRCRPR